MPNAIKYNVSAETLALKKGNFYIGTGDVGKGPTSSTGFYNGITPPSGGYTIYLNKETGGPSIYTVTTEAQIVSLTNSIGSQNFTTSGQCLNWFATQTDKMIFNRDYEPIVTNGLVLNLDAGFTPSYSRSGTTYYNISGVGPNGTLINGPTFETDGSGCLFFDGTDDMVGVGYNDNFNLINTHTLETWFYPMSGGNNGSILIRAGQGADEQYAQFVSNTNLNVWYDWYDTTWSNVQTPTNSISLNNWFLFSAVRNSTNLKLYLNGVLQTESTITLSSRTSFGSIRIGNTDGNGFQRYNGKIAVSRIYNRALTAIEVLQNYNAQKGRFGL
jgi:hypothetical protein